jgi:hypothetical protein
MKNLSTNLIAEKNKRASSGAWIPLLEIKIKDPANPDAPYPTRFCLCNNTEDIVFETIPAGYDGAGNPQVWTRFPFQLDIIKQGDKGEIPSLELSVSNITKYLQPYLEEYKGGINSDVKIIIINTNNLGESYTELTQEFIVLETKCNNRWVVFTLGAPNPVRQRFPLYRYIAKHCRWQFGSVECGYNASDGESCKRTYEDCQNFNNESRFGGFIGLQAGRTRFV